MNEIATIHLLSDDDMMRTNCGLDVGDLPWEQITGLPRKATCRKCQLIALDRMYANYEANTSAPREGL